MRWLVTIRFEDGTEVRKPVFEEKILDAGAQVAMWVNEHKLDEPEIPGEPNPIIFFSVKPFYRP